MFTAILPLIVAIVGVLIYALASRDKVAEIGRILFFVGALVSTWAYATHVLHL
jgi:TM2 domain-containing membrane protein YozV